MTEKGLPTIISDNFPHFDKLECPFFDDCDFYGADKCQYNKPCLEMKNYQGNKRSVRYIFRDVCENYITLENLKFQVGLIIRDERDR